LRGTDVNSTSSAPEGRIERDDPLNVEALAVLSSQSCPFSELTLELQQKLLASMHLREYAQGEHLIREGEPGDHLLLIISGSAAAFIHPPPIDRTAVGEFGPGDVVGEIGLLTGEPRTADVVARTAVRALSLSVNGFGTVATAHPEVRVLLTNVLADRLGKTTYDGLGGKDIHGYRILRCVGRGGMGIVYEAVRISGGDTVALKMLNHRLLYQPRGVQRFKREAEALASLHHESIARLDECFSAYGTQFLVMEFCRGATLKQLTSGGRVLDEPVVRKVIGQLAAALCYVHAQGLIHRDLKPSNVMVTGSGVVKLLDFGLVKPSPMRPDERETVRAVCDSVGVYGTPKYMAPEQFGEKPYDWRVDLYGLACIAFEALSGRRVIEAADLPGIIQEKLRFVVPPRESIGRGVTIEMHELLVRGLDCHPENRMIDLRRLADWAGPVLVELPPEGDDQLNDTKSLSPTW
jgi:CRP-like cAMP-binding protein